MVVLAVISTSLSVLATLVSLAEQLASQLVQLLRHLELAAPLA
jgi:hypothetical protein